MLAVTAIPKSYHDLELTKAELQGCAFCGFEHFDPETETLNEFDACPTCAQQLGHFEVRVCRHCGELYPADGECSCGSRRAA